MGKIIGFLRSFLLLAAVLSAAVLGFLRIKKRRKSSIKSEISFMDKLKKFFRSPVGIAAALIVMVVVAAGVFVLVKKLTGPPKPPEFAAVVNGEGVPYSDYQTRLDAHTYFYTAVDPRTPEELVQIQNQVIEDLIQEKLLAQVLAEHGITVTDEEVRARIRESAVDPNYDGDWDRYESALNAHYRTTLSDVMRTFRLTILKEKASQLKTQKHLFGIWVAKVKVPFGEIEEEEANEANKGKLAKAEGALERVRAREDFAVLARELSEHEPSAARGGDFGFLPIPEETTPAEAFPVSEFPAAKPVLDALIQLQNGENGLFEGFTGYLVATVTEIKEGPLGTQTFNDWYRGVRTNSDVAFYEQ